MPIGAAVLFCNVEIKFHGFRPQRNKQVRHAPGNLLDLGVDFCNRASCGLNSWNIERLMVILLGQVGEE